MKPKLRGGQAVKRILSLLLIMLIGVGIYFDLTIGSLPKKEIAEKQTTIPYQEVTVQAGFTVLSIVEHLHDGPVPATIQQIIADFKTLNPNIDPEEIQVGQTYLFPVYSEQGKLEE